MNEQGKCSERDSQPKPLAPDPKHIPSSVSRADRERLVAAYQTRALQRADPLTANLEVISGDLMQMLHRIRESMDKSFATTADSAEDCRKFHQQAETYLKFVRQVDRLAQITRQVEAANTDEQSK